MNGLIEFKVKTAISKRRHQEILCIIQMFSQQNA